jgi:two-component system sensor histidine kinase KdpD
MPKGSSRSSSEARRPDPDALLAKVAREDARRGRGHLKIFFGAAAGVGKTFAMLLDARNRRAEGQQVIVGLVETHGRSETAALLEGLETLPPRTIEHRGANLKEFDLDAALQRRPGLLLVDELAHSNAPGSRHTKRWQDVEELLNAGIDVFTTLNVQHLDSLRDVVGQITGISVWETVPDTFFDQADEVELVDLPPDDLLERLREGKVYIPEQAEHAIRNFFRKGNLIALREMALRRTADRVDAQMRDYREDHAIQQVWPVAERILVCVGPGPLGERLVRAGRRLATTLRGEWIVVYIETPALQKLPSEERDVILKALRLAEQLGAETMTLSGPDMSEEILNLAHARNVTKVVMGSPRRTGWRRWILGSVVDAVSGAARDFDLYLVGRGDAGFESRRPAAPGEEASRGDPGIAEMRRSNPKRSKGYLWSLGVTVGCSLLGWALLGFLAPSNLVMIYLAGVIFVAARYGRGPSILASVLSVLAFDFFFVPPYLTFGVTDTQYIVTFVVMLLVAMVISHLTANMRLQARVAGFRERRARALYAMTKVLIVTRVESEVIRIAMEHISTVFVSRTAILLPDAEGRVAGPQAPLSSGALVDYDLSVAQYVCEQGVEAGRGTETLAGSRATYLPIRGATGVIGVLALAAPNLRHIFVPEQRRLLEAFMTLFAEALERVRLAKKAQRTQVEAEAESLRNALLSAISHDLRTPLATIVGASSSLVEDAGRLTPADREELQRTVYEEAQRMAKLANNILDMARLDAGKASLNLQWVPLEEVVGSVVNRMRPKLEGRNLAIRLAPDLPLVRLDPVMMEQVLLNLLENSAKYSPPGTGLEIAGFKSQDGQWVVVTLEDSGPGFPEGETEKLFEKFYRAPPHRERAQSGVGLGLTICRAIVRAHGGRIEARNRLEGGAQVTLFLPLEEGPSIPEPENEMAKVS